MGGICATWELILNSHAKNLKNSFAEAEHVNLFNGLEKQKKEENDRILAALKLRYRCIAL